MVKKAQSSAIITLLVIAGLVTVGVLAWNYNWLNLRFKFEKADGDATVRPGDECPKTSADMGQPCCKRLEGGELQAAVGVIYGRASCGCPLDTHSLGYAPEGNSYLLCECNDCPK